MEEMNNRTNQLDLALHHHTQGNLAEAARLYRKVLKSDPTNPEALHLSGVVAFQTGKLKEAKIGRAHV